MRNNLEKSYFDLEKIYKNENNNISCLDGCKHHWSSKIFISWKIRCIDHRTCADWISSSKHTKKCYTFNLSWSIDLKTFWVNVSSRIKHFSTDPRRDCSNNSCSSRVTKTSNISVSSSLDTWKSSARDNYLISSWISKWCKSKWASCCCIDSKSTCRSLVRKSSSYVNKRFSFKSW